MDSRDEVIIKKSSEKGEMILLNSFGVSPSTPLGNIGNFAIAILICVLSICLFLIVKLLTKLENLSHILIWSSSNANVGEEAEISLIELPRLKLKFRVKIDETTRGLKQTFLF